MTTQTTRRSRRAANTEAAAQPEAGETISVAIPDAAPDEGSYIASESGNLDVRLEGRELIAFRRFHAGLIRDSAKLADGRPVSSKADALRYLFGSLIAAE